MDRINILVCQEDTLDGQLRTFNYLNDRGGNFVTIGRIIKPPKTIEAQIRTKGVVLLDLNSSTSFNIDRQLIPEISRLTDKIDVRIHRKIVDTKYESIKDYPYFINAYKIYGLASIDKHVVVGKRVIDRVDTFSVMHPTDKVKFGDAENSVLEIYTEDELIDKLQSIRDNFKLVGATFDEDRGVIRLNRGKW